MAGLGMERFVSAPRTGRFRTQFSLGDTVSAGELLGQADGIGVRAPVSGMLRAVTARGAHVTEGHVVAEVDGRLDPALCYGIDQRAARIAQSVTEAIAPLGFPKCERRNRGFRSSPLPHWEHDVLADFEA